MEGGQVGNGHYIPTVVIYPQYIGSVMFALVLILFEITYNVVCNEV